MSNKKSALVYKPLLEWWEDQPVVQLYQQGHAAQDSTASMEEHREFGLCTVIPRRDVPAHLLVLHDKFTQRAKERRTALIRAYIMATMERTLALHALLKPGTSKPGPRPRAGVTATKQAHVRLTEEAYDRVRATCRAGETVPDVLREGGLLLAAQREKEASR